MNTDDDRRLTPAQAAEYLGVSQDEVYRLCSPKDPQIVHYRVGMKRNRIAIPMSSLRDYDDQTIVRPVASLDAHRLRSHSAA